MPDEKEPIPKFAARIKAKYPEYKDIDDTLLINRIVEKYPEYGAMVDMGETTAVKKKEKVGSIAYPELESETPSITKTPNEIIGLANEYDRISGRISEIEKPIYSPGGGSLMPKAASRDKERLPQIEADIKASGYEPKEVLKEFADFPANAQGVDIPALLKEKKENPLSYARHKAAYKWQVPLFNTIREKDPENADQTIQLLMSGQAGGDYQSKRQQTQQAIQLVKQYVDDPGEQQNIIRQIAADKAFSYGVDDEAKMQSIANDERYLGGNGLNKYQIQALHFLEDTDPQKAEAFNRLVAKRPDDLWGGEDIQRGYEQKAKELEGLGMDLERRALEESMTSLQNKVKAGTATDEDAANYQKLYSQYETFQQDAQSQAQRFPHIAALDADRLAQEALGQRSGASKRFVLGVGENVGDAVNFVGDLLQSPFRSKEERAIDDLEDLGNKKFISNVQRYRTTANQIDQPDFVPDFKKPLADQISEVKEGTLDERLSKVRNLILNNFDKVGQKKNPDAGKFNFTTGAVFNTISDIGAEIASSLSLAATTGGVGNVSKARSMATLFSTTFATAYNDYYNEALEKDVPNPSTYAILHTTKEALTELINNDLIVANKFVNPKSTLAQIVKNIGKQEWDDIAKTGVSRFSKAFAAGGRVIKGAAENTYKETFEEVTSQLTGNAINMGVFNEDVDLADGVKATIVNTVIGTLPFGLLGAAGEIRSMNRNQKYALYEAAQNKDKYLQQLNQDVKAGALTQEKADGIKTIIENAANKLNELSEKNTINQNKTDNEKVDILAEKVQSEDTANAKEELLIKLKEKAGEFEKGEKLQYFIDKAAEAPAQYYNKYGKGITDDLLSQVPTEKLKQNLDDLLEISADNPNVPILDKLISQREPSPSMETQEGQKEGATEGVVPSTLKEGIVAWDKEKNYRVVETADEAIGKDVSFKKGEPFDNGAFILEFEDRGGESIEHHKGSKRGDIEDVKVDKVYFDTEYWTSQEVAERELSKMRVKFPNAEFIPIKINSDLETVFDSEYGKPEIEEPATTKQQSTPTNEAQETTQVPDQTEATGEATGAPNQTGGTTEEGGGNPPTEAVMTGVFSEQPPTELSFRGLQNVANEFGYEDVRSRDVVSDIQERQNARATAQEWRDQGTYNQNIEGLLTKIAAREMVPTAKQRLILQQHLANKAEELRSATGQDYNGKLAEVRRLKEIGQIARQEAGAALRIPEGGQSHPVADYGDAAVAMAEAIGVDELNEQQKKEVDDLVSNYEQKDKDAQAKIAELEAKLSEMEAAKEVKKTYAQKPTKKKTAQEYKDERATFREELKAAKEEHEKWLKEQGIQKAGIGLSLTPKMIKAIGKIAKSHIQEVGDNIAEVTKRVLDEVKDFFPDITEVEVQDIISGSYDKEAAKLEAIINRNEKATTELREKIANQDFSTKEKPKSIFDNAELKKKYLELYKGVLDSITAREDAKHDFDVALAKAELAKRTPRQKIFGIAKGVIATSKAIASGIDFSAIMMQNLVAMVSHPRSAAKALPMSFVDMASDKSFTRWLAEIHNSENWELIEKSGLNITDPKALREEGKDEPFSGNLLDKQFKIKDKKTGKYKKYQISKFTTKPFERQFTSLGNRMRVNMFLRSAQRWTDKGQTFETHPEKYKSLARMLNTETGRGGVPDNVKKSMENITPLIWSPRLIASRLNLLGISDLAYLTGKKGYYAGLDPQVRNMAIMDMVKFVGFGIAVMGVAAYFGAETDDDPESPTFGTIKFEDKKYNAWGGFTPYIKTIYQSVSGKQHTSAKDKAVNAGVLGMKFLRGRLTPFAGTVTNLAFGKDYSGKPFGLENVAETTLLPISIKGIIEGLEKDGTKSIITQGVPSIIGIGVSDERDYTKKTTLTIYEKNKKRLATPEEQDKYDKLKGKKEEQKLAIFIKNGVWIDKYGDVTIDKGSKKKTVKYDMLDAEQIKDLNESISRQSAYQAKKELKWNKK